MSIFLLLACATQSIEGSSSQTESTPQTAQQSSRSTAAGQQGNRRRPPVLPKSPDTVREHHNRNASQSPNSRRGKPIHNKDVNEALRAKWTDTEFVASKMPKIVSVPAGRMNVCRDARDQPQRVIRIDQAFEMMSTEVTQTLWDTVSATRLQIFSNCKNCPIDSVSWYDAIDFSNLLSAALKLEQCYQRDGKSIRWPKGLACTGWRLPTDAEWEYAARSAGKESLLYVGSDKVEEVSWFLKNSNRNIQGAGQKRANKLGLFDMSGNVWEWVWERRPTSVQYKPLSKGKESPEDTRIRRGGSWSSGANNSEVCTRGYFKATVRNPSIGFRLVRSIETN